ncbi:hypothetical protein XENTR_v10003037 [Xenopus tropicalis]|nr:hypothetical protein XENTR_v10003037 [Xenopus tropicalis]
MNLILIPGSRTGDICQVANKPLLTYSSCQSFFLRILGNVNKKQKTRDSWHKYPFVAAKQCKKCNLL